MTPRTWKDQPAILEGAKIKTSFHVAPVTVEVREASDGSYYVTVGTLFWSQTLWAPHAALVLDCIEYVKQNIGREPWVKVPPPEGTQLMEAD